MAPIIGTVTDSDTIGDDRATPHAPALQLLMDGESIGEIVHYARREMSPHCGYVFLLRNVPDCMHYGEAHVFVVAGAANAIVVSGVIVAIHWTVEGYCWLTIAPPEVASEPPAPPEPALPPGSICEQCFDELATAVRPAPWGGEMGVCAGCDVTYGVLDETVCAGDRLCSADGDTWHYLSAARAKNAIFAVALTGGIVGERIALRIISYPGTGGESRPAPPTLAQPWAVRWPSRQPHCQDIPTPPVPAQSFVGTLTEDVRTGQCIESLDGGVTWGLKAMGRPAAGPIALMQEDVCAGDPVYVIGPVAVGVVDE